MNIYSIGLVLKSKDRSRSGSSMDSFNANDELASLEDRLKLKLVPSAFLRYRSVEMICCQKSHITKVNAPYVICLKTY